MENDNAMSAPSTSVAHTNSQSSGVAPTTSFRDLIFSVSGTMPASVRDSSQTGESADQFCGKRKFNPTVDDCSVDVGAEIEKSDGEDRGKCLAGIVSESDVGITEFISQHDGFSGILKQR